MPALRSEGLRVPPSEEAASLIRALATELAFFCKTERTVVGGSRRRHVGFDMTLCGGYASLLYDGRIDHRPCSARCDRVTAALALAAERLGCSVEDFHATKRRRATPRGHEG